MSSTISQLDKKFGLKLDLKTVSPFLALIALFILGILVNQAFLSTGNLTNILTRSSFIGIIAVGATFVITAGGIDLSVGSMAAFISGCMIVIMNTLAATMGPGIMIVLAGVLASVLLGTAAGFVNGFLTHKR